MLQEEIGQYTIFTYGSNLSLPWMGEGQGWGLVVCLCTICLLRCLKTLFISKVLLRL